MGERALLANFRRALSKPPRKAKPDHVLNIREENIRLIFGLKLRQFRQAKQWSLKKLSTETGISASYLNEIEKGKKYPGNEKAMAIANALDIGYDDLVSLQLTKELDPLSGVFNSGLIHDLPLDLFGIDPVNLMDVMANSPEKFGALAGTLAEIARNYDMKIEHFLFAALRTYQERHGNYFEDLEEQAITFAKSLGLGSQKTVPIEALREILEKKFNYSIDMERLGNLPELREYRYAYRDGRSPKLFVNDHLMESQIKFVLAKEIGYKVLGLRNRARISTWLKVESFEIALKSYA